MYRLRFNDGMILSQVFSLKSEAKEVASFYGDRPQVITQEQALAYQQQARSTHPAGSKESSKAICAALVEEAMTVVREKFPNKTDEEYSRAKSTLATHVIVRRRGNRKEYTLSVPEANIMLAHTEVL